MKITKSQLRKIIEEQVGLMVPPGSNVEENTEEQQLTRSGEIESILQHIRSDLDKLEKNLDIEHYSKGFNMVGPDIAKQINAIDNAINNLEKLLDNYGWTMKNPRNKRFRNIKK